MGTAHKSFRLITEPRHQLLVYSELLKLLLSYFLSQHNLVNTGFLTKPTITLGFNQSLPKPYAPWINILNVLLREQNKGFRDQLQTSWVIGRLLFHLPLLHWRIVCRNWVYLALQRTKRQRKRGFSFQPCGFSGSLMVNKEKALVLSISGENTFNV